MSPGFFITFEGTEGGGKSTQIQLLSDRLKAQGHQVLVCREPGGTQIGEEVRQVLKDSRHAATMQAETELLLLTACRAQLVQEVIRPALLQNQIVLCDRFYDSTFAYQGYGRGIDLSIIAHLTDLAVGPTRPHLTLLLSVPLAISEKRRMERGSTDRFEEAGREFYRRVEYGFEELAKSHPERIEKIEATQSVEKVHEAIWQHCHSRLLRMCTDS